MSRGSQTNDGNCFHSRSNNKIWKNTFLQSDPREFPKSPLGEKGDGPSRGRQQPVGAYM